MKLLAFILQTKTGQPLIISTSSCFTTKKAMLYTHTIYQYILETYRSRNKIERTLVLQRDLICVCNINKEYICYIFVRKGDIGFAFDGIRKITEHFSYNKNNGINKLENINKKLVQYMSVMEQFLYTRQISLNQYLPFNAPVHSKKKNVDLEIFNKFAHVNQESDRRWILEAQKISNMVEFAGIIKKCNNLEQARNFMKKGQDELEDLLETDPQKQRYINQYRKAIIRLAVGNRKKKMRLTSISLNAYPTTTNSTGTSYIKSQYGFSQDNSIRKQDQIIFSTNSIDQLSMSILGMGTQMIAERQLQIEKEKLKMIKIKLLEKLQLTLHNGKVKEVVQIGQILAETTSQQSLQSYPYYLNLISPLWSNTKILNRRISPDSISITQLNENKFELNSSSLSKKGKPIIDYVLRKETFTSEKIPLLFIYNMEVSSNNIQFIFKYKLNEKFHKKLFDIQITVYLNQQFIPMDCKTIPSAHSLKNNRVSWKTKEISWSDNTKSKGKILLAFVSSNIPPKQIIKEIKLTMKCMSGLIETLDVAVGVKENHTCQTEIERMMIIQYKVLPNDG